MSKPTAYARHLDQTMGPVVVKGQRVYGHRRLVQERRAVTLAQLRLETGMAEQPQADAGQVPPDRTLDLTRLAALVVALISVGALAMAPEWLPADPVISILALIVVALSGLACLSTLGAA